MSAAVRLNCARCGEGWRARARKHLADDKRLGHIVVGADIESLHNGILVGERRTEKYGSLLCLELHCAHVLQKS